MKVPIHKSQFISTAADFGFEFHHAEHQMSLLKLWLKPNTEDKTPMFATHQIGVSGNLSFSFNDVEFSALVLRLLLFLSHIVKQLQILHNQDISSLKVIKQM